MVAIERDFRIRDEYLSNVWYSELVSTITKPGALKGISTPMLPIFIKNITFLTSLEVRRVITKRLSRRFIIVLRFVCNY